MTSKTRTPSFRALEELKAIATSLCKKAFHDSSYSDSVGTPWTKEIHAEFDAKRAVVDRISKEIENYAVAKYKEYGVTVVPVCKRSSSDGDDRLNVQLKVHAYPDCKKQIADAELVRTEYADSLKSISVWYFRALKAVAEREALPEIPQFKERE